MKVLVLGSGTTAHHPATHPAPGAPLRTHSAIAVSGDGQRWVLLNASSDIGQQLRNTPQLQSVTPAALPAGQAASSPIHAVVLMDAHIDHVAGLLSLREGPRLNVFATPAVFEDLTTGLPLFHVLENYCGIRWQVLPVAGEQLEASFQITGMSELRFTALAMPGVAPPYSLHRREATAGDHIAVLVEDLRSGHRLFYSPGPVPQDDTTLAHLRGADRLLIDGSDWPGPTQHARPAASSGQNVLIHVNVAPPAARVELAYDGMEIEL